MSTQRPPDPPPPAAPAPPPPPDGLHNDLAQALAALTVQVQDLARQVHAQQPPGAPTVAAAATAAATTAMTTTPEVLHSPSAPIIATWTKIPDPPSFELPDEVRVAKHHLEILRSFRKLWPYFTTVIKIATLSQDDSDLAFSHIATLMQEAMGIAKKQVGLLVIENTFGKDGMQRYNAIDAAMRGNLLSSDALAAMASTASYRGGSTSSSFRGRAGRGGRGRGASFSSSAQRAGDRASQQPGGASQQ